MLLEVENLRTSFDTASGPLQAVDGVSLTLDRGATLGIVGESGSGKSVLARTIMGLLGANGHVGSDSRVRFDGRDLSSMTTTEATAFWGREMAMIFQDPLTSLNPVRRVGVQITDPLRHHLGLSRSAARDRAAELLATVGIPDPKRRLDEYPHQLSGGMRQRVSIAVAISCEPKLLFADEPTTALDVTVQRQILDLLSTLQEDLGMAMVLITHDLGVVAAHADQIAVMYAGRIVERADAITLFEDMRHPYTAALFASIPQLHGTNHARLDAISGRPPDMTAPPRGCRFSPRCRSAREQCTQEQPVLLAAERSNHEFACFLPVGSPAGLEATAANAAAGVTAAGLDLNAPVAG